MRNAQDIINAILNKPQVLMIGGGMTFRDDAHALEYYRDVYDIEYAKFDKSWKDWLSWSLEDGYEFIKINLPTRDNAKYEILKVVFEKYFAKFNDQDLHIIAHSLGTLFILKYLTENNFPKQIKSLHLVAPIVANKFQSVNDVEDTGSMTFDVETIKSIENKIEEISVWHSVDDEVCSIKNSEYILSKIAKAKFHKFENKGHFNQSTFVELFDVMR